MSLKIFTASLMLLMMVVDARYFIVGPAQMIITSVRDCPEFKNKKLPMVLDLKPRMYNSTLQLVDATVILPVDINENITIMMKSQKIDKAKPQSNAFTLNNVDACTTLNKYIGELWHDIEKQIGIAEPDACPIKKGSYHAKNVQIDLSKMKVQMFFEGVFRSKVVISNTTSPIMCKEFDVLLEPKKN